MHIKPNWIQLEAIFVVLLFLWACVQCFCNFPPQLAHIPISLLIDFQVPRYNYCIANIISECINFGCKRLLASSQKKNMIAHYCSPTSIVSARTDNNTVEQSTS
jgi:hypothetical protein